MIPALDMALDIARLSLAGALGVAGLVFALLGVTGLLRFPDLFTRVHAFGVIAGLSSALVLLALALIGWHWMFAVRLALLGGVIAAAGPVLSHLTAGAAHAAGLAPLSGAYTAPRPGSSIQRGDQT